MAAARHDPAVLAEFQAGERCLVWARLKADGLLYRLADGTARELKPWAKEHVECFMPDCGDRRLTTVARHPRRRDGFRHHVGAGGHSAESEAHQQGKAALVGWIEATLGPQGVTAVAERSTSDRKRVADVMVTWPDGRQVALEVQYAPLSMEHWRRRHESYREQGIVDVWLFGHDCKHLRPARKHAWEDDGAADGMVALGDLHQAISAAGVPILWINPVASAVATGSVSDRPHVGRRRRYDDGHDDEVFDVPPRPGDQRAAFHRDDLAGCMLTPDGLVTPSLTRLRAAAAALAAVDQARKDGDAAEAAAAADREWQREEENRRETEARVRWIEEQRAAQQADWAGSALRQGLLARHGAVPPLLSVVLGSEGGVYAPAEHWRAAIYRHLIWQKKGESFTVSAAYAAVHREGIALDRSSPGPRALAIVGWLAHVEREGYVDIVRDRFDRNKIVKIVVRGDLKDRPGPRPAAPPAPPAPVAAPAPYVRSRARSVPPRAVKPPPAQDEPAWAALVREELGARPVDGSTAESRPIQNARLTCRRCRLPLDPVLADTGLHIGC